MQDEKKREIIREEIEEEEGRRGRRRVKKGRKGRERTYHEGRRKGVRDILMGRKEK